MKPAILALSIVLAGALAGPAAWAQRYPKRPATWVAPDGTVRPVLTLGRPTNQNLRPRTTSNTSGPAPGALLCHIDPVGNLYAAFVNTSAIPSGSTITGWFYMFDNQTQMTFTGYNPSQSLPAISYTILPAISNFGELFYWNGADFAITIQVQPPQGSSGTTQEVSCQSLIGEHFSNSALNNNAPLISGVAQSLASNKDVDLVLNGYFTADTPTVIMVDPNYTYTAPAGAVTLSGGQITVDLSQIQDFNLANSDTLYVTVTQDNWSDTIEYRYLPLQASGAYNPAPQ